MSATFNDTTQFILDNFAHTRIKESKALHSEYRICADRCQIEAITGKKFNDKGDLHTKNLCFEDSGISISFYQMVKFTDLTCCSRR